MQIYKSRDFSHLVSDTIVFFKKNGRNYFKNYFLINGLVLLLLIAVIYFGFSEILQYWFSGNTEGQNYYFDEYFEENVAFFVVIGIVLMVLIAILGMLNYTFPLLYLKRIAERQSQIKPDQILADMKQNIGRFVLIILSMVFVVFPLFALVFVVLSLLASQIWILQLPIFLLAPVMLNVTSFFFFDYLNTQRGLFPSLGYAIRSHFSYVGSTQQPSPFFKYWGASIVMVIITNIIVSFFTTLPMTAIFIWNHFVIGDDEGLVIVLVVVFSVLSIFLSLIIGNMIMVITGLMYYDSRIDLHKNEYISEIESIGSHQE